jgi:hypothetical protein
MERTKTTNRNKGQRMMNNWRYWNYRYWWRNIKRIFDYIPILWDDFDFHTDIGLYRLMRKKLERVEPCLRNGHLMNGERYARQICVTLTILDRIIANEYDNKDMAAHDKKWGQAQWRFTPIDDGRDDNDDEKLSELHIDYPNAHTDEEKEHQRKEFMTIMTKAATQQQRDIDWVFKHVARWHRHWWD